jgi:isocitrate dehydrogenase
LKPATTPKMETIGVDVFLYCNDRNAQTLGDKISKIETANLHLSMITNRGVKVYPDGLPETFCTDHWRCRYKSNAAIQYNEILQLLSKVTEAGFEVIKTENLCRFDGVDMFSAGQGA